MKPTALASGSIVGHAAGGSGMSNVKPLASGSAAVMDPTSSRGLLVEDAAADIDSRSQTLAEARASLLEAMWPEACESSGTPSSSPGVSSSSSRAGIPFSTSSSPGVSSSSSSSSGLPVRDAMKKLCEGFGDVW